MKDKVKSSKDKGPYAQGNKKTKKSSISVKDANTGSNAEKDEKKEIIDELTIDIVKDLGGTEDDLRLLAMETENFDGKNDDDLEEDAKSELQNLIKSLNFSKYTSDTFTVKDEEVESPTPVKEEEKPGSKGDSDKHVKKDKNVTNCRSHYIVLDNYRIYIKEFCKSDPKVMVYNLQRFILI